MAHPIIFLFQVETDAPGQMDLILNEQYVRFFFGHE
jgi:hypothetical protein